MSGLEDLGRRYRGTTAAEKTDDAAEQEREEPGAGGRLLPGRLSFELLADVDTEELTPGRHIGCHALAVA